ncbi:PREDICTED: proline-, glutamic acid- and leucine-rich protein 1-like isoform X1 [Camelina sativa]|uniref:Proline-, glutamic acid- and leucine-rich protein 1-like isoform X1 n=2 Tax=Camelina sativa TaxID=90675 RepID=A0ABM1R6J1_CAMSA|nr:PREDICTED: proline-, glutamic acid- and leucine-rich protein 1-like isoform X2 [Camelina sativa]XP_019094629.1 PREDICTED: proline-, glutamic acid- and leucine-rich protein 1-like isoform X1 [Camelina sativa]
MASFERFEDMCDSRLKPKILQNLLSEYVPNEKQPLTNFLVLSKVVSTISTHKLLTEPPLASIDQSHHGKSKSAVDDWVNRLLALVSSDMPDKCWVGVSLMGVTCQECSSDRFISSYSVWFNSLLSHLKNPASSRIVRVASCTSISDLLTRLSRFLNTKKDAVSHAAKVILPIIKLLEEDSSEALWEGIVHLLSTVVILFPAAFHSNYDKVEAAIASKIFSAKTSCNMLKKFAHLLALLPKVKGTEDSWSLMMQKLLISINVHLNNFFQGLEEETKGTKAIQRLTPPGKDSPLPLGGQNGGLDDAAWNSEQLIVSRVSALMLCSSTMLTSSYKSKINIPVGSLLSLVERVLAVNGSLPRAMSPFMTGIQQELVCAELPTLHSSALELLRATIKSIRSQLLPYAASVVRLVSSYFRKCSLPELRIKLYSITTTLLKSMGIGMAMQLAQEVVTNASADLDPRSVEVDAVSNKNMSLTNGAVLQACSKKRKHSTNSGVEAENSAFEVGVPHNHSSSPITLKIASLEALETLLTIGGALGSDSWRERVDNLLMTTATSACEGRWANTETYHCLPNKSTTDLDEFQLAALRAFLASLVSPSRVRPAFLAEGLELFRTGKLQAGMKVAGFCAQALMSLEVVIHPRALPLDGLPSLSNLFPESNSLASQKHNTPNPNKLNGIAHDGDDLCNKWLANADVPSNNAIQRTLETTLPFQETKRLKVGNDLATVTSLGVQDPTDMVASENVQQADVPVQVPEGSLGQISDKDATAPQDGYVEVVSGTQEGEDYVVKDSLMEEASIGKRESLDESDDDSIPSLKDDDFLSDSDAES